MSEDAGDVSGVMQSGVRALGSGPGQGDRPGGGRDPVGSEQPRGWARAQAQASCSAVTCVISCDPRGSPSPGGVVLSSAPGHSRETVMKAMPSAQRAQVRS